MLAMLAEVLPIFETSYTEWNLCQMSRGSCHCCHGNTKRKLGARHLFFSIMKSSKVFLNRKKSITTYYTEFRPL